MSLARRLLAPVLGALLAAIAPPLAAQVPARDSARLVTITRELIEAITPGDSTVWARTLAPSWFLSDEEGHHITRGEFLASMHPLPAGQHGSLTVARWALTGDSSAAVISYDVDETHDFYGQRLATRFHVTDTYVRRQGRWWQLASQVTALPTPVAGVAVPASVTEDYVGTYALTPKIRLTIVASDSGLALQQPGRPPQRLYALDSRIFIRHGVRGFWVFERDSSGAVAALVNWRDNNAVTWRREPAQRSAADGRASPERARGTRTRSAGSRDGT